MSMPNLLRYSEDLTFASGAWGRVGINPTLVAVTPPAGIPTAQVTLLTVDQTNGDHCVLQPVHGAAGDYILRFWAKPAPGSAATKLYVYCTGGNQVWIELGGAVPTVLTQHR